MVNWLAAVAGYKLAVLCRGLHLLCSHPSLPHIHTYTSATPGFSLIHTFTHYYHHHHLAIPSRPFRKTAMAGKRLKSNSCRSFHSFNSFNSFHVRRPPARRPRVSPRARSSARPASSTATSAPPTMPPPTPPSPSRTAPYRTPARMIPVNSLVNGRFPPREEVNHSNGSSSNLVNGLSSNLVNGLSSNLTNGLSSNLTNGPSSNLTNGSSSSVTNGSSSSLAPTPMELTPQMTPNNLPRAVVQTPNNNLPPGLPQTPNHNFPPALPPRSHALQAPHTPSAPAQPSTPQHRIIGQRGGWPHRSPRTPPPAPRRLAEDAEDQGPVYPVSIQALNRYREMRRNGVPAEFPPALPRTPPNGFSS